MRVSWRRRSATRRPASPGGYGVAFRRMLQDGIVARYLRDHCPQQQLKLCPYRDELPVTADEFLDRFELGLKLVLIAVFLQVAGKGDQNRPGHDHHQH